MSDIGLSTMDDLEEQINWLSDWVYLHTIIEGAHTDRAITMKDCLLKRWANPEYILSDEEERLLNLILEQEIENEQEGSE